ncbi:MAG: TonB-dependent receptor [Paludibacter sp.]|nr:TonB-dependent receptor [Paludibacter sp.]
MNESKKLKQRLFRRMLMSLLTVLFTFNALNAQVKSVTGIVKDANGEAIIGATVRVNGTTIGAVTNLDGQFILSVPANAKTLDISYVGMKNQEVSIKSGKIIVTLIEDTQILNEVVAIGYGTARRKDITGSVSSINAEAISSVPVSSAIEAMSGKLAGVQITTTEGSPDAEMKIRVRGGGSITGDNTPLFIVDGFPVNSINDIAPNDIESIDVLKDASSTAIYGSRGANGVVIVTTKSGKVGKINVNYNAYVSWKKIAKTLDVLTAQDYAKWQYELALLDNDNDPSSYEKFFGNYQDIDLYDNVATNNWQQQVFGQTGFTFNHNLSIDGGTDKSKFAFNYSRIDDKAIMQLSNFKRDNLSLKLSNKPTKNISIDFSTRYSGTEINGGGANEQNEKSSADSRLKYAMLYTPFPIKNFTSDSGAADDTEDSNLYNPLVAIPDNNQKRERITFNMAGSVTWEVIDNLKLKTDFGYDDYRNNDSRFYGTTTYYVKNLSNTALNTVAGFPAVILTNTAQSTFRNTNTLNYDFKKLLTNKNHHLNILLGQEYILEQSQVLTNNIQGFPSNFTSDNAFKLTTQGVPLETNNFYSPNDVLLSFFGRANYDYMSRYLLSATFRADGSSKFSPGNQWGYFPSAAFAWRVSSEPFMESTKSWLDDMKLRVSLGSAGNNNIPSGQIAQSYESKTTSWIDGISSYWAPSKTMSNPDLKWETTVTRNIGLDFTLLKSSLSGSLEVYLNTTSDLLIQFPVAGTGYDYQYRNMGETENRGLEATLNWFAIDKKNYGLSFSGNIGFNKNKINSLGIMSDFGSASGWASTEVNNDYWIAKGGSVGEMFGYISDGRYEVSDFSGYDEATGKWILNSDVTDCTAVIGTLRPGSMKLKDLNDDGKVTEDDNDRTIIGNTNPVHTGGMSLNGRLYGFDLSANFNWSVGNDIYNANKIEYTSTSKYQYRNMISIMSDGSRWTNLNADGTINNNPDELAAMNANTTMWSPYMKKFVFSDWAVEDGSFLRLNTLTLGYTLPTTVVGKLKIQKLRLYVTGYNVFTLTNYTGFDPEVSTRRKTALTPGVDYSAYPKSRQILVGLNLNF